MTARRVLFTWAAQRAVAPIAVAGGAGAWFWDADGRRYLDLASVVFSANAGWQHPAILAAVHAQLDELALAGPAMEPAIRERAAAALARHLPAELDRILFTLGGADANEHAVKIAMLATGRSQIVCRERSYHGATFGALTWSGDPRALEVFPRLPGALRVRDPYCFRCPWGTTPEACARPCAAEVEAAIVAAGAGEVAAVLMETVPGTRGGYFPPQDYYARVREICDRHGALLILDEVLTGFGRTGTMFAFEAYGVVPDLVTLGKGITSGHAPLGAVAMRRELAARFDDAPLVTGLTHTAHPLSLAALEGNLRAFADGDLLAASRDAAGLLATWLDGVRGRRPEVVDARSRGLYGCLELAAGEDATAIKRRALAAGLHVAASENRLFLAPPLVVGLAELGEGLERLEPLIG
ncbi:MAG: aminotransferase class III-fold pyridoxal phosphate-dependent enzyme [Thermoanaerobaculia bacterium]|nr:aminotransferase class III-fold pyridoxal phosphate-dependent enzyme [Thermoanaerobaculia bacterium]